MANTHKTLNTRFQLKIDTHENWIKNDPKLLMGEIAIATVSVVQEGKVNTVPSVLMKVGDGEHKYSELEFTYSRASDVYGWAKAKDKPSYAASEITGMEQYISNYVNETMGITVDTDTQYKLVKVDDYNYKLQSKGKTDTTWADTSSTIVIPKYDDTAVKQSISGLETLVGDESVATQIGTQIAALNLANTYEQKGEAAKVQSAFDSYKTTNDAAVKKNADDISALGTRVGATETAIGTLNGTGTGSIKKQIDDAFNDFATKVSNDQVVNTYKELIDYAAANGSQVTTLVGKVSTLEGDMTTAKSDIGGLKTDVAAKASQTDLNSAVGRIATAEGEIDTLQTDLDTAESAIDALETKVGDKSVAEQISAQIEAQNLGQYATDTELNAVSGRVTTLETNITKKANTADLAAIATSGNINDLVQDTGDYIIFSCGSSSTVI